MKRLLLVAYISTFSLMTPLGIGIGMALTETVSGESDGSRTVVVAVLQGLAAGTLVYVVFFEILEKERSKKANGLLQVSLFVFRSVLSVTSCRYVTKTVLITGNVSRTWICCNDSCITTWRRPSWRPP